jgi:L-ascorbate metabolism protein UlaG (beta-lactamase superfamily)
VKQKNQTMNLTFLGHSCFLLETLNSKILFDPFISGNELAKHIYIDTIEADFIVQSHGHLDHIADLVAIAKRTNAVVISSWELTEWAKKQGIEKVHPMNIGGSWNFSFGKLKMVFAAHSNSLPDGSYGGTAAGFILELDGKRIYYAGDTALTQDMKLIGEYSRPDLAILPIGNNFTMDIDDAILASDFVQCKEIVGMHFDTFGYIKINHEEAIRKFKLRNKTLHLLDIGYSLAI